MRAELTNAIDRYLHEPFQRARIKSDNFDLSIVDAQGADPESRVIMFILRDLCRPVLQVTERDVEERIWYSVRLVAITRSTGMAVDVQ